MSCRELRFVLSVVFYVVNENPQSRIGSKSCKKQKKTPEIRRFQVLFWSCWADSNRRPHPYQKAVAAFMAYPFMPGKNPQSLVLQGIGGSPCFSAFYYIPGCFAWI